QFAASAGLPDPLPALAPGGGANYAVGGAQTGSNGIDYVSDQLGIYLAGKATVPSTNLYAFWAGANDLIAGNNPVTAADNLEANIATLAGAGGKYFLWFNLPLLGEVPAGAGDSAALNAASAAFNAEWQADITSLKASYPGIVLAGVDIGTLVSGLVNDPNHDGFQLGPEAPGADLNGYLFSWDGLHPTSDADSLIANLALTDFEAAIQPGTPTSVPEPASTALAL